MGKIYSDYIRCTTEVTRRLEASLLPHRCRRRAQGDDLPKIRRPEQHQKDEKLYRCIRIRPEKSHKNTTLLQVSEIPIKIDKYEFLLVDLEKDIIFFQFKEKSKNPALPASSREACAFAKVRYSCRVRQWQKLHRQDEPQDPTIVSHGRKPPG